MHRILLLLVLLASPALACLWDRDTLAEEAAGRPDLVKIIVGWFDRHPANYYQMRLDRVTGKLLTTPDDLALHDDAAVASDRLGRPDEAIAWMAKKKAIIDLLPESAAKPHRYRYLANLGTFHVHRWVSQAQDKREADLSDLRAGEKLIAQAIEENPDAHFGSEIYQLMAIRWMLWDSLRAPEETSDMLVTHDEIHWVAARDPKQSHIDGIAGLIQLGAAWQSTDAFRSLAAVLDSGRLASIAELAFLREKELFLAGKSSLHPVPEIRKKIFPSQSKFLMNPEPIRSYFPIARAAADQRHRAWTDYQEARFVKGMHPDTHPNFWNAWIEPAFPRPPGPSLMQRARHLIDSRPGIYLPLLLVATGVFTLTAFRLIRRVLRSVWRPAAQ